jgi:hypothetical protein
MLVPDNPAEPARRLNVTRSSLSGSIHAARPSAPGRPLEPGGSRDFYLFEGWAKIAKRLAPEPSRHRLLIALQIVGFAND